MVETELGNWRRTHYSNELDPSLGESDVTVMGWISSVRGHGNISFATIIDKMGEIQIVAKKGSCPDNVLENISKLKQHSCVGIIGKVKASEKAPNGIEMTPKEIRIFSAVEKISPFDPYAKTVKNIDTRLDKALLKLILQR
jgi:aspartyl-tRNA synthetase